MASSASTRPVRSRFRSAGPLRVENGRAATVEVDGRGVQLTHLDKVFWPDPGITKRDLLNYYLAVGDALLPHLRDRAMVM